MRSCVLAALAAASAALAGAPAVSAEWKVDSPDGKVSLTVRRDAGGRLTWDVACAGSPVLDPSPLGIVRRDATFAEGLALESAGQVRAGEEAWTALHGKRREVRDRYNERILAFRSAAGGRVELHLRAFDDGAAFRYRFPETSAEAHTVTEELTGFHLPADSRVWAHPYDDPGEYTPAYETYYEYEVPAGTTSPKKAGWAFPVLFRTPAGRWGLVTEAAVDGSYCGSRLAAEAPGGLYRLRFPDPAEGNGTGAVEPSWKLPWATPWRVVVAGASAAPIVESTIVESLNPPSIIADTSWIVPGRASWSWLFDHDSPQDAPKLKEFVDLCADMGWEYSLVDANWDIMRNGTIHDVLAHAKAKGVGLLFWYNSGGPHNVVTERPRGLMDLRKVRRFELERLARWGVKGVKVDFFQSDKQNVMALYHDILKDAADCKIMVNFHGCTLPRGWSRTYPHLMGMEAVRGEECYSFDRSFPAKAPRHNCVLPFTRNAVGPMDYTPTMFVDNVYKLVVTAGHEIALPVVFECGWLHFAGGPEEYRTLPEVPKDFLRKVPAAWDETRLVAGDPSKLVVMARRTGKAWYVGGINGEGTARDVEVPLSFLGAGNWTASIIEDGAGKTLASRVEEVSAGSTLKLPVRPNGGFAIVLAPRG
jgi:alpha-glucosidase